MTGQDSNDVDPRARSEVERFAEVLSAARQQAGDPSFRKMAGRSGCISHTTLHEATKGYRFPSWPTTAEFAKSIGRDPADFRQQWERVDGLVNPPEPEFRPYEAPEPTSGRSATTPEQRDAGSTSTVAEATTRTSPASTLPGSTLPGWTLPAVMVGIVVLAAVVVTAFVIRQHNGPSSADATSSGSSSHAGQPTATGIPSTPGATAPTPAPVSASCPAKDYSQKVRPLVAGDHAVLAKDVTYPDCSHVPEGKVFVKAFDLKNTGSATWSGRTVVRSDLPLTKNSCRSEVSKPIPYTEPGRTARVEVKITAPKKPGLCVVRWMMADHGQWSFPGQKPFKAQVVVTAKK